MYMFIFAGWKTCVFEHFWEQEDKFSNSTEAASIYAIELTKMIQDSRLSFYRVCKICCLVFVHHPQVANNDVEGGHVSNPD